MNEFVDRLATEFEDAEYAHAYMESHAVTRIAAQIHALRKDRGLTQKQLAEKAGIAQERVSKIESGDFSSLTMKTLQKFSRAFDVNLVVGFAPFSRGIVDLANLSSERLNVKCREKDLALFTKFKVIYTGDSAGSAGMNSGESVVTVAKATSQVLPSTTWQDIAVITGKLHADSRPC